MQSETKVDVWMPLYVSDFLTATLGWSAEERGHYLTLLMAQWANGGLPSEPRALDRISPGVGGCWSVVGEKFLPCKDGRLRNQRLEEHRSTAVENREKKVAAAHAANEAKRLKREAADSAARLLESQTDVQTDTVCATQTVVQTDTQTDTPSPSSASGENHPRFSPSLPPAPSPAGDGPAAWQDGWMQLRKAWNDAMPRTKWRSAEPPQQAVERLGEPGWLDEALTAIADIRRLAANFDTPPTLKQFCHRGPKGSFVARLLGGEFSESKPKGKAS